MLCLFRTSGVIILRFPRFLRLLKLACQGIQVFYPKEMQQRHSDREQYFRELSITSEQYFIPYVSQFIHMSEQTEVLEIGCGEGGNLLPFAKLGCKVTGIDILPQRIEQARAFFEDYGYNGTFLSKDILKVPLEKQYDVIIIHDAIEHIYSKEELLRFTRKALKPEGICFIGFPSWQMPFGGHQQICRSKIASHFPFIHLLPGKMYPAVLRWCGENKGTIDDLLEIKSCRMTIGNFERLAEKCGWQIINRKLYFINPHYEIKFGLRPRVLSKCISGLPFIRNYFSSSCFYILKSAN